MRAVDTNVLVRLFIDDDPEQFTAATHALASGPIFIPKSVIVELEWVLRGVYGRSRTTIASVLDQLMSKGDVEIEDEAAMTRAIDWFKHGMDLADAIHLASSRHADSFLTFDAAMRRRAVALAVKPAVIAP